MDLFEAITTRRSVRRFQDRPVGEDLLERVLEAARWAPSWVNFQPTRYTVVTDPELKARLVDTMSPKNPARKGGLQAPVLIAVSARVGLSGFAGGTALTDKGDWYMFDAALAVQNLTLAAHALGLGTVQVGLFDAPAAAAVLELPEGEVMVELIPLGWPLFQPKVPPRLPLDQLVRRR